MALDLRHPDRFTSRHLGPDAGDLPEMLKSLGITSLDTLIEQTVPAAIRMKRALDLPAAKSEAAVLEELAGIAAKNQVFKSFLGGGYHDTVTPEVILRNIVLNPGWYTAYTPYQAEIAQGRLEALLNYQTMVIDLTGMEIANASLLDEGTAAAEAMHMLAGLGAEDAHAFFVSEKCHAQTIAVVQMRAKPLGIPVIVGDHAKFDWKTKCFGVLLQYPDGDGAIHDYRAFIERAHSQGAKVALAADILALTLLTPPGELGADVALGNTQRFGVPLGFGGPHAAYFATKHEFARTMPGRLIGLSVDANRNPALRMALQTREQHIRREKATSNICTAQVLLAVVASMYAVYHGPKGLKAIGEHVHAMASALDEGLKRAGLKQTNAAFFDTLRVEVADAAKVHAEAAKRRINLRAIDAKTVGVALDECTTMDDVRAILECFGAKDLPATAPSKIPAALARKSEYLKHPVFHKHHTETGMQRYMRSLEARDFSLVHGMIPLGSCTMKLNAASEMAPITWPAFNRIHPFAPAEQTRGYQQIFADLEKWLAEITGFAAISLQPNAGSQGEYAGLLVIRAYHESRGEGPRDVVLIPQSAHGTNPASAVMAGYHVVVVKTDENGNIDVADLEAKAKEHGKKLAALMVTYPSTHGVFEEGIVRSCQAVHEQGGQVYMDGANMNAQVGLCRPGDIGADVCHLNLHKTFCIPHGGGGPGMGPIGVAKHLAPFLPGHPVVKGVGGANAIGPISAAPWGSASILLISWVYIRAMGPDGLTAATKYAILNANYVAARLEKHYPTLYKGAKGRVAHECILDTRVFKKGGVEVDDIAKRLMDYGFHAPTMSFPVAGTLMVEPTESEPKEELDRFIDAMIAIREEIRAVEDGKIAKDDNPLKNAPHTVAVVTATEWKHPYTREQAAFPAPHQKFQKFWPWVGRVNNAFGDRNLVCACPPMEDYLERKAG